MSALTERMVAALGKIADKLGEGLTATLTTVIGQVYDPTTGGYTDAGTAEEWTFACAPVYFASEGARGGGDEAVGGGPSFTMPRVLRSDGSIVEPKRGDRLTVGGVTYQVVRVHPVQIGDGIAGYGMELST